MRLFHGILVVATALVVTLSSCDPSKEHQADTRHRLLMATLYQQTAAEAAALSIQSFNMAEIMIHAELQKENIDKKRAIITDIDETVLDNSPYEAKCILEGISYPEAWDEWCNLSSAQPVPGALRFFNYVASKDIEIFYITNRKQHLQEVTLLNLKRKGFPFADADHILMRTTDNSKEPRRKKIMGEYRVVLLLGDNLDDFTNAFEGKSLAEREEYVEKLRSSFGRRYIVFPNAMYGSWENAIYQSVKDTLITDKDQKLLNALSAF